MAYKTLKKILNSILITSVVAGIIYLGSYSNKRIYNFNGEKITYSWYTNPLYKTIIEKEKGGKRTEYIFNVGDNSTEPSKLTEIIITHNGRIVCYNSLDPENKILQDSAYKDIERINCKIDSVNNQGKLSERLNFGLKNIK